METVNNMKMTFPVAISILPGDLYYHTWKGHTEVHLQGRISILGWQTPNYNYAGWLQQSSFGQCPAATMLASTLSFLVLHRLVAWLKSLHLG